MSEQNTTILVALRAAHAEILKSAESRLETCCHNAEQAFASLGWELDTCRDNLKTQNERNNELYSLKVAAEAEVNKLTARIANLQDTNKSLEDRCRRAEDGYYTLQQADQESIKDLQKALSIKDERMINLENAISTMFTPAQLCERVNAVHDEMMQKLSAERNELETVQLLLKQARDERDAARSERDLARSAGQQAIDERDRLQAQDRPRREKANNIYAANVRLHTELNIALAGIDALTQVTREAQLKLDDVQKQKDDLDNDYGKLVGEYDDLSQKHELLRNLIMDPNLPGMDRYSAFARALGVERKEAKTAIHKLVTEHPVCKELQQKVDVLCRRAETEDARHITNAELLHHFPTKAQAVLNAADECTRHALSSLQYGQTHHCLARLREAVMAYQVFLTKTGRRRPEEG